RKGICLRVPSSHTVSMWPSSNRGRPALAPEKSACTWLPKVCTQWMRVSAPRVLNLAARTWARPSIEGLSLLGDSISTSCLRSAMSLGWIACASASVIMQGGSLSSASHSPMAEARNYNLAKAFRVSSFKFQTQGGYRIKQPETRNLKLETRFLSSLRGEIRTHEPRNHRRSRARG